MLNKDWLCAWVVSAALAPLANTASAQHTQTITIKDTLTVPAAPKVVYTPRANAQVILKAIYGPENDLRVDVVLNGKPYDGVGVGVTLSSDATTCQLQSIDLASRAIALQNPKPAKNAKGGTKGDICPQKVAWTGKAPPVSVVDPGTNPWMPRQTLTDAPPPSTPNLPISLTPTGNGKVIVPAPAGMSGLTLGGK